MDREPLVRETIDIGADLIREFDRYAPIKAAFWLKGPDDDHRYLYLSSDQIDDTKVRAAYGEVVRLWNRFRSPFFDPMWIKVIGGQHPLAQAAAEINARFPQLMPNRIGNQMFGGVFVEDVYIYPTPIPVTASC